MSLEPTSPLAAELNNIPAPVLIVGDPPDNPPETVRNEKRAVLLDLTGRSGDQVFGDRVSGLVLTPHSILKAADLDFTPVLVDVISPERTIKVGDVETVIRETADGVRRVSPGYNPAFTKYVVRADNGAIVGMVGDSYKPIPYSRTADLALAFLGHESFRDWTPANAIARNGGAQMALQIETERTNVAGYKEKVHLTFFASHDRTLEFCAGLSSTFIVCKNTFAMALGDVKAARAVSVRHSSKAEEKIKLIEDAAKIVAGYTSSMDDRIAKLLGTEFNEGDMIKLASHLFPQDSKQAASKRKDLLDSWRNAPGADTLTAFGAAMAVTHYATHKVTFNSVEDSGQAKARASEGVFADYRGNALQAKAWDILFEEGEATTEKLQTVTVQKIAA